MSEKNTYEILGASPYNINGINTAHNLLGGKAKVGKIEQDRSDEIFTDEFIKIPTKSTIPGFYAYDTLGNLKFFEVPKMISGYIPNEDGTMPDPETATPDQISSHIYDTLIPMFHPNLTYPQYQQFITWMEVEECPKSELIPEITEPPINLPETPTEETK